MYVVDASVWVSRFIPTDCHYQPSLRWLRAARDELIMEPAVLLPEIGGPVARITGRSPAGERIVSLVQRLPNVRLFLIDLRFARLSAHLAADLRLRGADSIYVALAALLDIPLVTWDNNQLVTWDNNQLDRGGGAVTAVTPAELLSRSSP